MRKRNFFVVFLLLCTISSSIFAYGEERLYLKSDYEYEKLVRLSISSGVIYPSTEPISGYEIINTLNRIDDDSVSPEIIKRKQALIERVSNVNHNLKDDKTEIGIRGKASANLELFYQNDGTIEAETLVPFRDRKPFLSIGVIADFNSYASLYVNYDFTDPIISQVNEEPEYWSNFDTLIHFTDDGVNFFPATGLMTQAYQPFKAGISAGGKNFNFQIGRNRQSFGQGITGNLIIGDNFSFQEYAKVSFFSKYFGYYFDITHFDQQTGELTFDDFRMNGFHQYRVMHRFEVYPLNNLLISINLGGMFETEGFDPRMLTPMFIVHAFNNFSDDFVIKEGDEANNIMSLDLSWAFLPNYLLTAQIAMDQLTVTALEGTNMPSAFGFLINLQNTVSLRNVELLNHVEFVYTMPYLYLNNKYDESIAEENRNFNYDHIVGYHITGGDEIGYSGYQYGPDSFVVSIGSSADFLDFKANLSLMYKMHGIHGIKYHENQISNSSDFSNKEKRYTYEHEISLRGGLEYEFLSEHGNVFVEGKYSHFFNYHNIRALQKDLISLAIGVSFSY